MEKEKIDASITDVPAVELKSVWVFLQGNTILEDISFSIKEGRFVGIIGPNGAGKTTCLKVILGLLKPDRGDVKVFGLPPEKFRKSPQAIGYIPQKTHFDSHFPLSVYDAVLMGRIHRIGLLKFPGQRDREMVLQNLIRVGLDGYLQRQIGELSGGELQRALIARALCNEPRLMILDEPTTGVDIAYQERFYQLLHDLKKELKLTIMVVSHDLGLLSNYSDELICINRSMHLHGSPSEVLSNRLLGQVYRCEFDLFLQTQRAKKTGE